MKTQSPKNVRRETKGASPKPGMPPSRPFATQFFLWAVIFAGAVGTGFGIWSFLLALQAESWPQTKGVIKDVGISRYKQKVAHISYWYTVAGVPCFSSRFAIGENLSHGQWVVDRYPVGKEVDVFYSPTEPQLAVLEPGVHGGTIAGLIVGSVFVLGGWGFLLAYKIHQPAQTPIFLGAVLILFGSLTTCRAAMLGRPVNQIGYIGGALLLLSGGLLLGYQIRNQRSSRPPH